MPCALLFRDQLTAPAHSGAVISSSFLGNPIFKQHLSHWLMEASLWYTNLRECGLQRALMHTLLGECQPRGHYIKGFPYKTFVPLQAGPLHIDLSDTTGLMLPCSSLCLRHGLFVACAFRPATPFKLGLASLAYSGHFYPPLALTTYWIFINMYI